ncbi:MAG: hypothetical protein ACYSUC_05270 [Planctomycetota bacterium]|jgi:hypothetical protein
MSGTKLLLNAYYEVLHERLEEKKELLLTRIAKLLRREIAERRFDNITGDKYAAYYEACAAFVDERIETYNPIGIQYTFEHSRRQEAFELELQLDWYDSGAEFEALVEVARAKAEAEMTEERLGELADELVREVGAFPDRSIISAYEARPGLGKLPDYVVAQAIEEIIK